MYPMKHDKNGHQEGGAHNDASNQKQTENGGAQQAVQLALPNVEVAIAKNIDGARIGVLKDGTPYMGARGVARFCGVAHTTILYHSNAWLNEKRDGKFAKLLVERGHDRPTLFIAVDDAGENVYPEIVCQTFLEYFAFHAGEANPVALDNMRRLATAGFRMFVYAIVGYTPPSNLSPDYQMLLDRLVLNPVPDGWFSVFRELDDFLAKCIANGLPVDPKNIPDISVGQAWGEHWTESSLEEKFGPRMKWEHRYPATYPQARSNPQFPWIYPLDALIEFKRWMTSTYVPTKLPVYLHNKVKANTLPAPVMVKVLDAVKPKALPSAK